MKKLFKKTKKGFTLVELLVVIAILAVLASVSVIGYLGFVEKARVSDDNTELHQIGTLVQAQLIDGSEDVLIKDEGHGTVGHPTSGSSCTAYTVYFVYADNAVSAYSDSTHATPWTDSTTGTVKNVLAAIKAMVGEEDSSLVTYLTGAKLTSGVLTLTYKHHASTASTWDLGTTNTNAKGASDYSTVTTAEE